MAEISAKLVKELREKTGAGMMDCKKALLENDGVIEKAIEWLRQKGIASAAKKEGRVAAEGLVGSYIHTGGRVGVLVEVNCETDFVARREEFTGLVKDVAMQIAACPNVEYVRIEDIPSAIVDREKSIEMGRDDLANKPENIREKIEEGRIQKRLKELSLMDQPFIRDQNVTVEELVKRNVAQLGENIQVRRFSRFVLGEGIEKEETNFADEVAAQAGLKKAEAPPSAASGEVEESKPGAEAPQPEAAEASVIPTDPEEPKSSAGQPIATNQKKANNKKKSSKKKK